MSGTSESNELVRENSHGRTDVGHVGSHAEVIDKALLRTRSGVVMMAAPLVVENLVGTGPMRVTRGLFGAVVMWVSGTGVI